MKKYLFRLLLTVLLLCTSAIMAAPQKSLALFYDEIEQGAGSQTMRYIINTKFMRIDNGDDKADFILFDISKDIIYSVNHDDQTILKIENREWQAPAFKFKVSTDQVVMDGAPKIQNRTVYSYQVKADKKLCTDVYLIKDIYMDEMNVLYKYQQVLSGQQVATLKNTPVELHTPCFLVDQVYHSGDYYKQGLPVQISYSRDYARFLKSYKQMEFDDKLFVLPETYKEYKAFTE